MSINKNCKVIKLFFVMFAVLLSGCSAKREIVKDSHKIFKEEDANKDFAIMKEQFIHKRISEGARMEEVIKEAEMLQDLLESPQVKESYINLKQNQVALQKAAEKIEEIDRAAREEAENNQYQ